MDYGARVPAPVVDAFTVGKAFVRQYYEVHYNMPEHLHRFYQDISKIGRVGEDGVMRFYSSLQGICEELKNLSSGDFKYAYAKITSFDAQQSHSGGILLVVTGYFIINDRPTKRFIQTFFLAPQEIGFFVLNDILRFEHGNDAIDGGNSETPRPVTAPTGNKGFVSKEATKPSSNENASFAKENVLVPEIVNEEVPDNEMTWKEVANDSLKVSHPDGGLEDVSKKSYASLKVKKDKSGVSVGLSTKQIPKGKEHQASSDPSPEQILKDKGHQVSSDSSPVIESEAVSEAVCEAVEATGNGHNEGSGALAEGTSIYVRHLPFNATPDMLETVFKEFGAIGNGGIQVLNQWGLGFPYGFVEFKEADAAQKAIEASPLRIGGQRAIVEEKRSTGRGENAGSGSGYGNRNMGGRGGGYGSSDYRRGGGGGRGGGREGCGGGGRSFNRRGSEYVARNNSY
ncbi:unnamed protein product [Cochlearia groenlandica]